MMRLQACGRVLGLCLLGWASLDVLAAGVGTALPAPVAELAYVSIRTGDAQIWLRDGSGKEHMLTSDKGINGQPTMSRDGRIAFVTRDAGRPVVMLMHRDGSERERLSSALLAEMAPSWSPDADSIAYYTLDLASGKAALHMVELKTRKAAVVPAPGRTIGPSAPVWSLDGRRLAFLGTDEKGRRQVWTVERDGTGLRNISAGFAGRGASWVDMSPDGNHLVWVADMRERSTHIVRTDLRSGESVDLTADVLGGHEAPRWSPDGRQIVFASNRDDLQSFRSDIFVMDADGGNVRNLSRHPAEDFDPKWSGDGRSIVFASLRTGTSLLYEVDIETGSSVAISQHHSHDMDHSTRPVARAGR